MPPPHFHGGHHGPPGRPHPIPRFRGGRSVVIVDRGPDFVGDVSLGPQRSWYYFGAWSWSGSDWAPVAHLGPIEMSFDNATSTLTEWRGQYGTTVPTVDPYTKRWRIAQAWQYDGAGWRAFG